MNMSYPYVNPPLPYGYGDLEPYIDTQTMRLHHDKHLETYVKNLNNALKAEPLLQTMPLDKLLLAASSLPRALASAVQNNGGGVYNHIFFFDGLGIGTSKPFGSLERAVTRGFTNYAEFKNRFSAQAAALFGSGYTWLCVTRAGRLDIINTPDQTTPLTQGLYPLLCIDVWEHAYYLKHHNLRADYITDFFSVINWDKIEERYCAYRQRRQA